MQYSKVTISPPNHNRYFIKSIGKLISNTCLSILLSFGIAIGSVMPIGNHIAAANMMAVNDYPDPLMPCLSGNKTDPRSSYGKTQGTGQWCASYNWGDLKTGNNISSRGYVYRNCTDLVAWKVQGYLGKSPKGLGHAKYWDDNAVAKGYTLTKIPEPGDAAVFNNEPYGHVAFVESVNANNTVNVSEYNFNLDGAFWTRNNVKADNYVDFDGVGIIKYNSQSTSTTSYAKSTANLSGDFTGDGYDDLLATSMRGDPAQNEQVFRGGNWLGGAEFWGAPPHSQIKYNDAINIPADIDGDHKEDLITITTDANGVNPNIWWQRSTGSSFSSPQLVGVPSLVSKNTEWSAGDITGDGYDDVIAFSKRSDAATNIIVFPSTHGWLGAGQLASSPAEAPFMTTEFLPADQNGDGKTDLYAINRDPTTNRPKVYVLRSQGNNLAPPVLTAVPNYPNPDVKFTVSDFDGDHKDDLLLSTKRSDTAPNLQVWLSDGNASYKSMNLWSAPGVLRWADVQMVPADINADGKKDLLAIQNYNGTNPGIYWVKSNGNNFASPQLVGVPNANYNQIRFDK